jgi:hypothetical protein
MIPSRRPHFDTPSALNDPVYAGRARTRQPNFCLRRNLPTRHGLLGEIRMRLIFGIIIGCLLTVGGAYVIDGASPAGAKQMVNWDVVTTKLDSVTALARARWKKITE